MSSMQKRAQILLKNELSKDISPDIKELIDDARADLYDGISATSESYPGFSTAVATIRNYLCDILPMEAYVDMECEQVLSAMPESVFDGEEWIEACTENLYRFEGKEILAAVVGKELVNYL